MGGLGPGNGGLIGGLCGGIGGRFPGCLPGLPNNSRINKIRIKSF